jgi:hypothetical protein
MAMALLASMPSKPFARPNSGAKKTNTPTTNHVEVPIKIQRKNLEKRSQLVNNAKKFPLLMPVLVFTCLYIPDSDTLILNTKSMIPSPPPMKKHVRQ